MQCSFHHHLIWFAVDFPNVTLPEQSSRSPWLHLRKVCIVAISAVPESLLFIFNLAGAILKEVIKIPSAILLGSQLSVQIRSQMTLRLAVSMQPYTERGINLKCPPKKWVQSIPLEAKLLFPGFFHDWFPSN